MPRDRLSDLKVRTAKAQAKPFKLFDGGGLYLQVMPQGARYWRLKYRLKGSEKVFAIGVYPDVSLAAARDSAAKARTLVREGKDPVLERQILRHANGTCNDSFEAIAKEWIASNNTWSEVYRVSVEGALKRNLYPRLGKLPMGSISIPVLRSALLAVQSEGKLDTLRKLRMWASQIFKFAIATGRVTSDPAASLQGTFQKPKSKNFPAITKKAEFGELIAKIRTYDGSAITRLALQLMSLTFLRTGELRFARWSEIDFTTSTWTVPGERMKGRKHGVVRADHIVPLSRQALQCLEELRSISGYGELLFPHESKPSKPMSENTMLYALYRLGYHGRATVHGFRASASTLLNEMGFDADAIERQLAHVEMNNVRKAYHRAEYIEERRTIMQRWADLLDELAH